MAHRIALVHAVRVAMRPVEEAFARHWPDAVRMHLLDDSLSRDRSRDGELTPVVSLRRSVTPAGASGE
jgi:hypothetical protein